MIWHIFRKDLRLLWPLAALMAATQFALAGVLFARGVPDGIGNSTPALTQLSGELTQVVMLAIGIFIAVVVYQDAPCSRNQDWLARPIAGRDLLIAKLLMIVLMVQGPMLLVDVFRGLTNGFSFSVSTEMAISRSLFFMSWTLPVFALVGVTENIVQAIAAGIAAMVVKAGFATLFQATHHSIFDFGGNPINEINNTLGHIVILLATLAVLGMQYFRRASRIARGVAAVAYAIFLLAYFLPWDITHAVNNLGSPTAGEMNSISVEFDPSQPKAMESFSGRMPPDARNVANVPVRFTGITRNRVASVDRMELQFIDASGKTIMNQIYNPIGQEYLSIAERKPPAVFVKWNDEADSDMNEYLPIILLPDIYKRLRDQNLRLEIRYWLTVSQLATTTTFSTVGDDHYAPNLGRCATSLSQVGVQLRCLWPHLSGENISCIALYLENAAAGLRDPESRSCLNVKGNFGLYPFDVFDFQSVYARYTPFPTDRLHYPIAPSQIATSRLIVNAYKPIGHVVKTLIIPEIRLSDWEMETPVRQ